MIIHIEQQWMDLIRKHILHAQPSIPEDFILCDDDIKKLHLFPAMIEYFCRFPIKTYQEEGIHDQQKFFNFPTDLTFGVLNCQIVAKNYNSRSTQGGSDFLSLALHQRSRTGLKTTPRYGKYSSGRKGPKFNPEGMMFNYINERQMRNALTELETSRYNVNLSDRRLEVYSSVPAKVSIVWANSSDDFEDVRYEQKLNVLDLASANLLEYISRMGSLLEDSNQDKKLNVEALNNASENMRQKVYEKWALYPNIMAIRGS